MKIRKRYYFIFILIAAIAVTSYFILKDIVLKDPYSNFFLKYAELGPSHYFRLSYRATFDGEPLDFEQLVECRPYLASGGIGGGTSRRYQRIPERAGVQLVAGGVVYFEVPHYCRFDPSSKRWQEYWRAGDSVETIPLTFWANKMENPDVIEAYTVPQYFTHAEARLRLEVSRVVFLPRGFEPEKKPETVTEFGMLGRQGWTLVPLPAEVRPEILGEVLAESASGRFRAHRITETAFKKTDPFFIPFTEYRSVVRWGMPLNLPPELLIHQEKGLVENGRDIMARAVPLLWNGHEYQIAYDAPPGLIYLYTGDSGTEVHVEVDRGDPTLTFQDERITLPTSEVRHPQVAFCDTKIDTCFRLVVWWEYGK